MDERTIEDVQGLWAFAYYSYASSYRDLRGHLEGRAPSQVARNLARLVDWWR